MNVGSATEKKAYYGITGLPSVVDAAIRATGRYIEVSTMKENPILRLPFRYISETIRYGLSRLVQNKLVNDVKEKIKTAKEIWVEGLQKAIEITVGSGFVEPNLFDERLQRVGAGFLNTIIRLVARGGMVLSKMANKENLNLKKLLDEFIARTCARLIYFDTDQAPIRLGLLTLEQLFINQWLAMNPVKEHVLPWITKKEEGTEPKLKAA